jgi:predicted nucleic acid-binding protein
VKTLVIDSSVAAKWFLRSEDETYTNPALDLLQSYISGQTGLVVPDLFWAEMGNIFWKSARQGRWSASDSEAALRLLLGRHIPTVPSRSLLEDASNISIAHQRTVYESIYVALAIASKTDLVTADERLANSLAAHLPVKWLGSWI